MSVYPGPDTYPGTDPGPRVFDQVRVHRYDQAADRLGTPRDTCTRPARGHRWKTCSQT